jgi:hypothetical protein
VKGKAAWVDAAFLNERGIPAVCFGPGSLAPTYLDQEGVPLEKIKAVAHAPTLFARGSLAG